MQADALAQETQAWQDWFANADPAEIIDFHMQQSQGQDADLDYMGCSNGAGNGGKGAGCRWPWRRTGGQAAGGQGAGACAP